MPTRLPATDVPHPASHAGASPGRRANAATSFALLGALLLPLSATLPVAGVAQEVEPTVERPANIFIYAGWKVFHQNCYGCHGVDATGTDIAPNLVERIGNISPEEFATKVLTRYRIVAGADDLSGMREAMMKEVREYERGQAGELVMPAWEGKESVRPHILDLYDYLKARADGWLGPGEPPL